MVPVRYEASNATLSCCDIWRRIKADKLSVQSLKPPFMQQFLFLVQIDWRLCDMISSIVIFQWHISMSCVHKITDSIYEKIAQKKLGLLSLNWLFIFFF